MDFNQVIGLHSDVMVGARRISARWLRVNVEASGADVHEHVACSAEVAIVGDNTPEVVDIPGDASIDVRREDVNMVKVNVTHPDRPGNEFVAHAILHSGAACATQSFGCLEVRCEVRNQPCAAFGPNLIMTGCLSLGLVRCQKSRLLTSLPAGLPADSSTAGP
jgi:hypothetical protein